MSTEIKTEFNEELMKEYGWSKNNNFRVVDILPDGHYYCITPKHLEYNDSMYLGKDQIERMEGEHGSLCGYKYGKLYADHKLGLVVQCLVDVKNNTREAKELTAYMKKCIKHPHFKEHDYQGFVLMDGFTK